MNALRFTLGFIAAFFDEYGMIAARNRIYDAIRSNGRTDDGFDLAFDHIIYHRRHWRAFFRKGR